MLTITTRKVNTTRRLGSAPVFVDCPCFEKDGKFHGDVPDSWDIEKATEAVRIANAWANDDRAPYERCEDGAVLFMAQELVAA